MWPFRRAETRSDRHDTVLELIESVAALRGQVKALEAEWDDIRVQIRKGYQRLEKAAERARERDCGDCGEDAPPQDLIPNNVPEPARGFARKLQAMRGA